MKKIVFTLGLLVSLVIGNIVQNHFRNSMEANIDTETEFHFHNINEEDFEKMIGVASYF